MLHHKTEHNLELFSSKISNQYNGMSSPLLIPSSLPSKSYIQQLCFLIMTDRAREDSHIQIFPVSPLSYSLFNVALKTLLQIERRDNRLIEWYVITWQQPVFRLVDWYQGVSDPLQTIPGRGEWKWTFQIIQHSIVFVYHKKNLKRRMCFKVLRSFKVFMV